MILSIRRGVVSYYFVPWSELVRREREQREALAKEAGQSQGNPQGQKQGQKQEQKQGQKQGRTKLGTDALSSDPRAVETTLQFAAVPKAWDFLRGVTGDSATRQTLRRIAYAHGLHDVSEWADEEILQFIARLLVDQRLGIVEQAIYRGGGTEESGGASQAEEQPVREARQPDRSVRESKQDKAEAPEEKPAKAAKETPPCWKKFPKGAEPYEPKESDVAKGLALKDSAWIGVQQQHHGNCAVQTAQFLARSGDWKLDKQNTKGYSEEEMEVLANCPNVSAYARSGGTTPEGSLKIFENVGMIPCHHPQTPENIAKATAAGFPVSTGHLVEHLWGQQTGGHRVATVGTLQDKKSKKTTAFLVHDTGRGCLYYVPAERYQKSLKVADMILVVGKKKNCKGPDGKAVKPGECCLARYNKRKAALAQSLPDDAGKGSKSEEAAKQRARELRDEVAGLSDGYKFGMQQQLLAEAAGDREATEFWKNFCKEMLEKWKEANAKWQEAKKGQLAKTESLTPMGASDPGAAADRAFCAAAAKNIKCEEERRPCPICGK